MQDRASPAVTHVAFADESRFNTGRYRGIALVTLSLDDVEALGAELRDLLCDSNVSELKWKNLNSAKERFAALKMVNCSIRKAVEGVLRVDVLTWDIRDSRHNIKGRDDIANLQRMYYHLFEWVLREHWPDGSVWHLNPDEHTAMDWEQVADVLKAVSLRTQRMEELLRESKFSFSLKREFRIQEITPCESRLEPIIQLADLYAGLGVYSRSSYDRYEQWQRDTSQQQPLLPEQVHLTKLSGADRERCQVLSELNTLCKKYKLRVSLNTHRGFRTLDHKNPINFWWYEPQHEHDRAPLRQTVGAR